MTVPVMAERPQAPLLPEFCGTQEQIEQVLGEFALAYEIAGKDAVTYIETLPPFHIGLVPEDERQDFLDFETSDLEGSKGGYVTVSRVDLEQTLPQTLERVNNDLELLGFDSIRENIAYKRQWLAMGEVMFSGTLKWHTDTDNFYVLVRPEFDPQRSFPPRYVIANTATLKAFVGRAGFKGKFSSDIGVSHLELAEVEDGGSELSAPEWAIVRLSPLNPHLVEPMTEPGLRAWAALEPTLSALRWR